MRAKALVLLSAALLPFAGCAAPGARTAMADRAILRLAYREQARSLPYLRLDGVQLQESSRLGLTSPCVWRFQEKELGKDYFLPLPCSYEMQDSMHEALSRTLSAFGFAVRGWPGDPQVLVGTEVKRLRLRSLGVGRGYRSCDLELEFILREASTGIEITRFTGRGSSRFEGSWTLLYRDGPRWMPIPGESDPVLEATREAALDFLARSLAFWDDPGQWKESVSFSRSEP